MSNPLAVAAVTSTLQQMLLRVKNPQPGDPATDPELSGADVSVAPLHLARKDEANNQLNLFLYQATYNAQLRNQDLPSQTHAGETGKPPLALDLHYLLTAYGANSDEILAHRLLGWAMSLLHDHAILLPAALHAALAASDLDRQVERIRITPQPITTEEMSRLWTIFSTNYRLSVAYLVSVVLIDSTRSPRAQLPVLSRAVNAKANTDAPLPPFPALTAVDPRNGQPGARLGEEIALSGFNLDGATPTAFFSSSLVKTPVPLPATVDAKGLQAAVTLPNTAAALQAWPAGVYTVTASPANDGNLLTNALPLAIAPRILQITPATLSGTNAKLDAQHALTLTVRFSPSVWKEQRLMLLVGARTVEAGARNDLVDHFTFTLPGAGLGRQFVRLRVDGVDSLIVDYTLPVPAFDPAQSVVVVP
jgi:hypothetical protein